MTAYIRDIYSVYMSTSKVIFNIPTKLKKAVVTRAEEKGITLTSLFTQTAQAFVEGDIDIEPPRLRPAVKRRLRKAVDDHKKGKNISPRFDNVTDAIKWLRSVE